MAISIITKEIEEITPYRMYGNDFIKVVLDIDHFSEVDDINSILDQLSEDDIIEYLDMSDIVEAVSITDFIDYWGEEEILEEIIERRGENIVLEHVSNQKLKSHMREINIDELQK